MITTGNDKGTRTTLSSRFLATVIMALAMLSSCGNSGKAAIASIIGGEQEVGVDSIGWQDSVIVKAADPNVEDSYDSRADVKAFCKYPTGLDNPLNDSIRTWICHSFSDSTARYKDDIHQLVTKWGEDVLRDDSACVSNDLKEAEGIVNSVSYADELSIRPIYEDDDFLTMDITGYNYMGGAHGSSYYQGVTFLKSDGHRVGFELLKDYDRRELQEYIKKCLKKYFEISGPTTDEEGRTLSEDDQLRDCLFQNIDGQSVLQDIPLPDTPPFVTEEGIVLIYQQYEIAPYAAGMPCALIPWEHKAKTVNN